MDRGDRKGLLKFAGVSRGHSIPPKAGEGLNEGRASRGRYLMNRNWQKTHRETSSPERKGEARKAPERGAELFIAEHDCESSKGTDKLMEEVCEP